MRYIRKEKCFISRKGKFILPECIESLSGFAKSEKQAIFIRAERKKILISIDGDGELVFIGKNNIIEIPSSIINKAEMEKSSIISVFLKDYATIEIQPIQTEFEGKEKDFFTLIKYQTIFSL